MIMFYPRKKPPSIEMETRKRGHEIIPGVKCLRTIWKPLLSRGSPPSRRLSKPSPGGHLPMPPAHRVRLRRPFVRRRHLRGLPCGAGVARSRGRGGSGGARESRCPARPTKTEADLKIQGDVTTATTEPGYYVLEVCSRSIAGVFLSL